MKKLTITGAMGVLCLLLVGSAYSKTLHLNNASPCEMAVEVDFAASPTYKHVVERTEESSFLGTHEVRKDKTIVTPSTHASVGEKFKLEPYATKSIEMPHYLFFNPSGTTYQRVNLTIAATIPSSDDVKGKIIGASSRENFSQGEENVLFVINADYPDFVDGVGRVAVGIFRMAGQDL